MATDYCKIFIDTDQTTDALLAQISSVLAGSISRSTVQSKSCEVDVRRNDEFEESAGLLPKDFLRFRYYVDVEKSPETTDSDFRRCIGNLLQDLWRRKTHAVASCSFEDALPRNQEYGS